MWVRVEGKTGVMKAKRYWPRKAEWPYNDDSDDEGGHFRLSIREKKPSTQCSGDDPRLRRLAQSKIDAIYNGGEIRGEEIVESWRVERMAADEEEDDEALAERRRKIKEKVLLQQEEAAALLPEESESESESESEYESESNPVEEMAMVKPVFVPKSDRGTIAERDKVKAEEQAREVEAERKRETREIIVEKIKDDFEIQKNMDDIIGGDVDDDDVNEAESYEAWKAREIARVKRDRTNMRDEEKEEEDRRDSSSSTQSMKKRRFMQRHYHKGCFFQNDADDHAGTAGTHPIYARDFSDPTGEDKMDKTILPKVMQVKHFGRRGRTKWTHLVNEDTTHCHWNNINAPASCC